MPRFLNVWTGVFEWHVDPKEVRYAILSHTWLLPEQGGEQSYNDVCKLQATIRKGRGNPRPSVSNTAHIEYHPYGTIFAHSELSDKIKNICKVARDTGFRLIWIDSCCIDKTSSAELSEAINSMYEWYRLSDACYVYLQDVPDGDNPREPESAFRRSRWHTRCWTLQELIAPRHVEFLTQTWSFLNTKMGLATTLETITGVDFNILVGLDPVYSASVARRMSWAATREATRIEDIAYSLMGIFEVHMSPIYGEGLNAFLRLQEEIVRTIPDQSIFAWSTRHYPPLDRLPERAVAFHYGLFAPHPTYFTNCGDIIPVTRNHFASRLRLQSEDIPPLLCVFTPQGVRIEFLTVHPRFLPIRVLDRITSTNGLRSEPCPQYQGRLVSMSDMLFALLQCEDRSNPGYLCMLPIYDAPLSGFETHLGRGSVVEARHRCENPRHKGWWGHLYFLEQDELLELLLRTKPTVSELHLLTSYEIIESFLTRHDKTYRSSTLDLALWPRAGHHADDIVFRIPPRCIKALSSLGFFASSPMPQVVPRSEQEVSVKIILAYNGSDLVSDHGCPQTIEITLVITKEAYTSFGNPTRSVNVYVTNFLGVPADDSEPPFLFRPPTTSPSVSPPIVMMPTRLSKGSPHPFKWVLSTATTAEWLPGDVPFRFLVPSDTPTSKWGQAQPQVTVRSVEIAVRPLLDDSDALHVKHMWLYVDVSEKRSPWPQNDIHFWYHGPSDLSGDSREDQEASQPSGNSQEGNEVHSFSRGVATSSTLVRPENPSGAPFIWDREKPFKTRPTTAEVGRIPLPRQFEASSGAASSRLSKEDSPLSTADSYDTDLFPPPPTAEHLARPYQIPSESTLEGGSMGTVAADGDVREPGADGISRGGHMTDEMSQRAEQDTALGYDPSHDDARDCASDEARVFPIERAPLDPSVVRPLQTLSDGRLATEPEQPYPTAPALSSSAQPEGVQDLPSEVYDPAEDDVLRAQTSESGTSSQIRDLLSKNAGLATQNAALSSQVTVLSSQMAAMASQMAAMAYQMAIMPGRLDALTASQDPDAPGATHSSEKENKDALRRENDALRRQASLMSSQIAELTSKKPEMVSQMTDMSSQIASLSSQMATVLARLESLPAASQAVDTARTSPPSKDPSSSHTR